MEARQSLREGLDKNTHFVFQDLVDKARLVMKHVGFFVICFCSLFLFILLICLDRAQTTKGIAM